MDFYFRTLSSEEWSNGPGLCPYDLEALLDEFTSDGYVSYWSEETDCGIYMIDSECLKKVIDGLHGMTDDEFKNRFSFEDDSLSDDREFVISELEYLYDNRDMNWRGGEIIYLDWS